MHYAGTSKAHAVVVAITMAAIVNTAFAGSAANEYVTCAVGNLYVVKFGDKNFHVEPTNETVTVYFFPRPPWMLVKPPGGSAPLTPTGRVPWEVRKPDPESAKGDSGYAEHCYFPYHNEGDRHNHTPLLYLPKMPSISASFNGGYLNVSGYESVTTSVGLHLLERIYSPCECGQWPYPPKKDIENPVDFDYFDHSVVVSARLSNGNLLKRPFRKTRIGRKCAIEGSFACETPLAENAKLTVDVEVAGYRRECNECFYSASETYSLPISVRRLR